MGRIKIAYSVLLIALAGCAATPQTVTENRDLRGVQETFPTATGVRDIPVPPDTPRFGQADQMVVKAIQYRADCLGYCVESTVAARSGPFRIRVLVDSNLIVKQARVVSYTWDRGRDVCKSAFTDQFAGKGPDASLQIGQDIDAMTGATLSSRAMTQGIRDTISMLQTIR